MGPPTTGTITDAFFYNLMREAYIDTTNTDSTSIGKVVKMLEKHSDDLLYMVSKPHVPLSICLARLYEAIEKLTDLMRVLKKYDGTSMQILSVIFDTVLKISNAIRTVLIWLFKRISEAFYDRLGGKAVIDWLIIVTVTLGAVTMCLYSKLTEFYTFVSRLRNDWLEFLKSIEEIIQSLRDDAYLRNFFERICNKNEKTAKVCRRFSILRNLLFDTISGNRWEEKIIENLPENVFFEFTEELVQAAAKITREATQGIDDREQVFDGDSQEGIEGARRAAQKLNALVSNNEVVVQKTPSDQNEQRMIEAEATRILTKVSEEINIKRNGGKLEFWKQAQPILAFIREKLVESDGHGFLVKKQLTSEEKKEIVAMLKDMIFFDDNTKLYVYNALGPLYVDFEEAFDKSSHKIGGKGSAGGNVFLHSINQMKIEEDLYAMRTQTSIRAAKEMARSMLYADLYNSSSYDTWLNNWLNGSLKIPSLEGKPADQNPHDEVSALLPLPFPEEEESVVKQKVLTVTDYTNTRNNLALANFVVSFYGLSLGALGPIFPMFFGALAGALFFSNSTAQFQMIGAGKAESVKGNKRHDGSTKEANRANIIAALRDLERKNNPELRHDELRLTDETLFDSQHEWFGELDEDDKIIAYLVVCVPERVRHEHVSNGAAGTTPPSSPPRVSNPASAAAGSAIRRSSPNDDDESSTDPLLFYDLVVDYEHRDEGIGEKLVKRAMFELKTLIDARGAVALLRNNDYSGKALYANAGFVPARGPPVDGVETWTFRA